MNEKQFEQYLQTFDTKPSPALRHKIFGTQNYWLPIGVAALFAVTFCALWLVVFTQKTPSNSTVVKTEPVRIQKTPLSYMRRQIIATGNFAAFVQKDTASSHQVYTASSRNLADFNKN